VTAQALHPADAAGEGGALLSRDRGRRRGGDPDLLLVFRRRRLGEGCAASAQQQDAVVADRDQQVKPLRLEPGQRVVGRGVAVGTVYRLADGRTVIVKGK
jgi:hypothetical protein